MDGKFIGIIPKKLTRTCTLKTTLNFVKEIYLNTQVKEICFDDCCECVKESELPSKNYRYIAIPATS